MKSAQNNYICYCTHKDPSKEDVSKLCWRCIKQNQQITKFHNMPIERFWEIFVDESIRFFKQANDTITDAMITAKLKDCLHTFYRDLINPTCFQESVPVCIIESIPFVIDEKYYALISTELSRLLWEHHFIIDENAGVMLNDKELMQLTMEELNVELNQIRMILYNLRRQAVYRQLTGDLKVTYKLIGKNGIEPYDIEDLFHVKPYCLV